MARRTTKKGTDPNKKKTLSPAQKKLLDTQQISDKRAKAVASGKMTYNEARKAQRAQDSTTMATVKQVGRKTEGSSQNTASKREYKKASFSRGKDGNVKAY